MKGNKLIRVLMAAIVISLIAVGCTKNRQMYEQGNYEAVNSMVAGYQALYDLVKFSDNMATSPVSNSQLIPVKYTGDTTGGVVTLHLNFGDSLTGSSDKRRRSGSVNVQYNYPYNSLNNPVKVSCVNYRVNGYMFSGILNYTVTSVAGSNKVISFAPSGMQVTSGVYLFTLTGNLTLNVNGFITDYIKGSLIATGSTINFNSVTEDSIEMFIATQCFEKGKTDMNEGDFKSVINYGDGQPDSLATATSETFRYIINLKRL